MTHRDGDCYDMSHQSCVVVVVRRDCLVADRHSLRCNNHQDQYYYTHLGYKFPMLLPILILVSLPVNNPDYTDRFYSHHDIVAHTGHHMGPGYMGPRHIGYHCMGHYMNH